MNADVVAELLMTIIQEAAEAHERLTGEPIDLSTIQVEPPLN